MLYFINKVLFLFSTYCALSKNSSWNSLIKLQNSLFIAFVIWSSLLTVYCRLICLGLLFRISEIWMHVFDNSRCWQVKVRWEEKRMKTQVIREVGKKKEAACLFINFWYSNYLLFCLAFISTDLTENWCILEVHVFDQDSMFHPSQSLFRLSSICV